jgi:hypothetical protein
VRTLSGPLMLMILATGAAAAAPAGPLAVVTTHCLDCHSGDEPQAAVALDRLVTAPDFNADFRTWQAVREVLEAGRMPPREVGPLAAADRDAVLAWLGPGLRAAVEANAGDPGPVTLRRLTNAEYDATMRDLTGIDLGLAHDFEPDGGGGEGFANTGDVLFVNPRQFDRYLAAARTIADQATILPGSGIVVRGERVGSRGPEAIRDQAQQALYVWYQKAAAAHVPGDSDDLREADYLLACWRHAHRDVTGADSLDPLADAAGLPRAFLANWWAFLQAEEPASRYLDPTRLAWRRLPPPDPAAPQDVPAAVTAGITAIQAERRSWYVHNPDLYWGTTQRIQQDAEGLNPYPLATATAGADRVHLVVGDAGDGNDGDVVRLQELQVHVGNGWQSYVDWLAGRRQELEAMLAEEAAEATGEATVEAELAAVVAALGRFGTHPRGDSEGGDSDGGQHGRDVAADEIVVVAPAVVTLPIPTVATKFKGRGRLDLDEPDADEATAQWLATVGDPPDPAGVIPGIITVWKRGSAKGREAMREFSLMKQAFPETFDLRLSGITDNFRFRPPHPRVYWLSDEQLLALLPEADRADHAAFMTDWDFARHLKLPPPQAADWDARVLAQLDEFAARAWRGPLTDDERERLHGIYRRALLAADPADADATSGLREQAAREALVAVLVAPRFLFRVEAQTPEEHPVTAWELAARLSYFLWSSLPDEPLRRAAADGSLLDPARLEHEVRRMLADDRAQALAREFAARWLRFHGFAARAPVDREQYPEFTPALQADMETEATAFLADMIREDRPLRELFGAEHTFLNDRLAAHYGIPDVEGPAWRRVDVAAHGRGGLLGMAAILASTSYPHRTSPVLRGNWVLTSVLGTPTPPPPADVPPLEESADVAAGIRDRLEAHRAADACAVCHDRIDPLGFALEGFDVLGRHRDRDDTSAPLDLAGEFVDGTTFVGVAGLRGFLADRRDLVVLQFCRKLLGYALGREVLPTDLPLLERLRDQILEEDAGFSAAVLGIVTSRQFLHRRGEPTDL